MKNLLICTLALLFSACTACGAAPTMPKLPRATARAAVDVSKDAWVLVARACIDTAEGMNDDSIRMRCAKYLVPAHALIQGAADAVDQNWNAGAACDLVKASGLLADAMKNVNLGPAGNDIKTTVEDAMVLAGNLAGYGCAADAGAE